MFQLTRAFVIAILIFALSACEDNEPCINYLEVRFSTLNKSVWFCTEAGLEVEISPELQKETGYVYGDSTLEIRVPENLRVNQVAIESNSSDVLIDGTPMGEISNVAFDRDGNMIWGGYIRT